MSDIFQRIDSLSASDAVRMLRILAEAMLHQGPLETQWGADIRFALRDQFNVRPGLETSSESDIAKTALKLACKTPELKHRIEMYTESQSRDSLVGGSEIAIIVAALVILQTRIKIKLSDTKKWEIEVEKQATGDEILKRLVEKMLSYIPGGPFKT